MRLACQVTCKQDMKIEVPEEVFGVRKWTCKVRSNDSVATFIKELVLELPEGESVPFRAGGFIQIERPPGLISILRILILKMNIEVIGISLTYGSYLQKCDETIFRAYSMANYPEEKGSLCLMCVLLLLHQEIQMLLQGK
jgi:Na+-transporting NADH:ubiquinone oxidoreductase subunit F